MKSSTDNEKSRLSEYQRGWYDAMTEAMRVINTHYVSYFHDPFYKTPRETPLMMSSELRDLRASPPRDPESLVRPVKINRDE